MDYVPPMPTAHPLGHHHHTLLLYPSVKNTSPSSFWKRLLIGLLSSFFIMEGAYQTDRILIISPTYGKTGSSLLLLGSCLLCFFVLTGCIGIGTGHKIYQLARRYQTLHGWIGITTGSFLSISFLAGAVTLFANPLQEWSTPPLPPIQPLVTLPTNNDTNIFFPSQLHHYRINLTSSPSTRFSLPIMLRLPLGLPSPQIIPRYSTINDQSVYYLQPTTVPCFIGGLHRRMGLPLPEPWVMPLVGIICLFYGLALLSGIILLLPGMWRNLMTIHLKGHKRRLWLDVHSLLGLCSLPFHLIIALTTAMFAFFPLIYTFSDAKIIPHSKHNTALIQENIVYPPHLISPDTALSYLHKLAPTFQPHTLDYILNPLPADTLTRRITLRAPLYTPNDPLPYTKTPHTSLIIEGTDQHNPMIGRDRNSVTLNPYTGTLIDAQNLSSQQPLSRRLLTWCLALHFGSFGGEFVRWLYVILALCGVAFFHSANQLWLNAHIYKRPHQKTSSKIAIPPIWLSHLTEGSLMGCLLGLCSIIALSPFTARIIFLTDISHATHILNTPQTHMTQAYRHISLVYYTCFGLSILGCCLLPRRSYRIIILAGSATALSIAITVVMLRHTATQNSATLSLTSALIIATLSLWGGVLYLLLRRSPPSPQSHP